MGDVVAGGVGAGDVVVGGVLGGLAGGAGKGFQALGKMAGGSTKGAIFTRFSKFLQPGKMGWLAKTGYNGLSHSTAKATGYGSRRTLYGDLVRFAGGVVGYRDYEVGDVADDDESAGTFYGLVTSSSSP